MRTPTISEQPPTETAPAMQGCAGGLCPATLQNNNRPRRAAGAVGRAGGGRSDDRPDLRDRLPVGLFRRSAAASPFPWRRSGQASRHERSPLRLTTNIPGGFHGDPDDQRPPGPRCHRAHRRLRRAGQQREDANWLYAGADPPVPGDQPGSEGICQGSPANHQARRSAGRAGTLATSPSSTPRSASSSPRSCSEHWPTRAHLVSLPPRLSEPAGALPPSSRGSASSC